MTDLLGPGDAGAPRALTTTTDVTDPQSGDTFFGDCVSGLAGTGTPIASKWLNRQLQQIRRAIRNSQIPTLANTDDDMLGQAIQSGGLSYAVAGGSVNAYAITLTPAPLAIQDGMVINVFFGTPNTSTTPTLTANAGSPVNILRQNASAVAAGDLSGPVQLIAKAGNWLINGIATSAVPLVSLSDIAGGVPTFTNTGATTATVSVSAFRGVDSTGVAWLSMPVASTAWAVANGNAANGFQGGTTLPDSATIYWALCQGTAGQCIFADTQFPVRAPSGYITYQRRLFMACTNSSGVIIAYVAQEMEGGSLDCFYTAELIDVSGATPATANRSLYSLTLPLGYALRWYGVVFPASPPTSVSVSVTSPDEPDTAITGTFPSLYTGNAWTGGSGSTGLYLFNSKPIICNTSGQIGIRCESGSAGQVEVLTNGFADPRRS